MIKCETPLRKINNRKNPNCDDRACDYRWNVKLHLQIIDRVVIHHKKEKKKERLP